jgi:hypothetical protein
MDGKACANMTSTTSAESLTTRLVISHLSAIASPLYDIGVFNPDANNGDGQMLLRTWTYNEVLESVGWLRHKNANAHAIYVRPSGNHAYTLIDDLTKTSIDALSPMHSPSAVLETSPNNFQAWLYHGETLPAPLASRVAANLAREFDGDTGAAAWNQFGRLAGFTNNKPRYRLENGLQPFVKLRAAKRTVYPNARATIDAARANLAAQQTLRNSIPAITAGPLKLLSDFHSDARYAGDLHRADLAFATYALAHGATPEFVADSIAQRDLSHKGSTSRQNDYIERTIAKAASTVGTV